MLTPAVSMRPARRRVCVRANHSPPLLKIHAGMHPSLGRCSLYPHHPPGRVGLGKLKMKSWKLYLLFCLLTTLSRVIAEQTVTFLLDKRRENSVARETIKRSESGHQTLTGYSKSPQATRSIPTHTTYRLCTNYFIRER